MGNPLGPIYETTFVVAEEVRSEFEDWLRHFRDRALLAEGIVDCRGFESEQQAGRYTFRFNIVDDHTLDELQDNFFADADADVANTFSDSVSTHSRILREDNVQHLPSADHPNCLNCGTRLRGQYCGHCGQRARSRLISMWELVREAFGDLFEFDSRLWRTLGPLLVRPGRLTRDYLEGRRARYMPPFRTYLVLSVIFFVIAFFNPRDDLSMLFEPEPEPTSAPEQLAEGLIPDEALDEIAKAIEDDENAGSGGLNITVDEDGSGNTNCTIDTGDLGEMPEWIQKRATPKRLERICEQIEYDDGDTFWGLMLDRLPIALIVLLPLMALVLKLLYPLSRRYFVEHLLFFVHFHAFFFLLLTLMIIFQRLGAAISLPEGITITAIVIASFYCPVYLYKAMRHVYGQGHLITVVKYLALLTAYLSGLGFTLVGAFLFAAISI